MEITEKIIFFDSDAEFEDFSIAPVGVVTRDEKGNYFFGGDYSDLYKKYIEEGKSFVIKDVNSVIYKRQCITKRVAVPKDLNSPRHDYLVQLPAKNLLDYYLFTISKKKKES